MSSFTAVNERGYAKTAVGESLGCIGSKFGFLC